MSFLTLRCLAILGAILVSCPVWGAGPEKSPPPQAEKAASPASQAEKAEVPEPQPGQILLKMCDFLKSHPQFSFKAEITDDRVYYDDKKLQYAMDVEEFVQRPDKIRINADGDLESKQFIYNGKTITLFDETKKVYATMEVPADVDQALEKARNDYGLRVGLAELGSNHPCENAGKGVKHSLYVGLHRVRGVDCHHLAFDRDDIHFQVLVDAGEQPVLRKFVITQKQLSGSPQYVVYFQEWNFSPQLNDSLFTFVPPPGTEKINFIPVKKSAAPATKKGQPKKKGGKS